jgi:hypothetical protein
MITYVWAAMALVWASPLEITVEMLGGAQHTGQLVELDQERIVVTANGQPQTLDPRDVLALVVHHPAGPADSITTHWIELVDGSHLESSRFLVSRGVATARLTDRDVQVETRHVRGVRFHPPDPARDAQWREIIDAESSGDLVVLRRPNASLDQLEGVLHDITDDAIEFEYDDQRLAVKREKLEGVRFFHPTRRTLLDPLCKVVEVDGSSWNAKSLRWAGDKLQLTTTGGVQCDVPVSQLARIDYSPGNVVYLSDLEFELAECTPFIATQLPAERILQLYQPRRDAGFEGSGLWLADGGEVRQYDKGLAIHSRSRLVFRLAEPARRLSAVVGIDSRLQGRGGVLLVVLGDNRELARQTIAGRDAPWTLDLDIAGVRKLEFLVDFGDALDVADHLNLCNARIIK